MKMNALTIGLIAAAGFLLWRYRAPASTATAPPTPTAPPEEPAEARELKDLKTALLSSAGAGMHTYDEWNYYYNEIKGIFGPSFEDVMGDKPRAYKMSVDEFMGRLVQKGVSGLLAWG